MTFSQVALLFHKNPLPLLLHMSSSQVRTFNNKRPLILLSFSFYSQKALTLTISSQVGDLLHGLNILLHCPALPSTSWGDVTLCAVVALLTTVALMLRCLRRSFHFSMSTCLLLFILESSRVTSIMILYRRHIPSMSALPPLLLRLEEQCAKHYYSLPWMCWAEARKLHIVLWQTLILA